MSSRGETRAQPSIPDSSPAPLCIEHVSLAVAVVALTIALGALVAEAVTHLELLPRGGYAILAALTVCGFVGFVGKLVLRELAALRAGQLVVREAVRQRQARREAREPVGAGCGHRPRGGDRSEYWSVYTDVLEDLGGLDDGQVKG